MPLRWHHGAMHCRESSNITAEDKIFKKEDLCRDHGNGLEVVCVEEYYQEATTQKFQFEPYHIVLCSAVLVYISRFGRSVWIRTDLTLPIAILILRVLPFLTIDISATMGVEYWLSHA